MRRPEVLWASVQALVHMWLKVKPEATLNPNDPAISSEGQADSQIFIGFWMFQ